MIDYAEAMVIFVTLVKLSLISVQCKGMIIIAAVG